MQALAESNAGVGAGRLVCTVCVCVCERACKRWRWQVGQRACLLRSLQTPMPDAERVCHCSAKVKGSAEAMAAALRNKLKQMEEEDDGW